MVGLVAAFDLGPPLASNDDWGFAWEVRHFDFLHVHLYPAASALALPQIAWAWAATFDHADLRLLRLSVVPFVLLAMYTLHRLARTLGAGRTWSAIAAISPLAFPVFAADATSFMTDVPYVALLLVAALGAVRWKEGSRWMALCIVFATLAVLQRQIGVAIPLAVSLGVLWGQGGLRRKRDFIALTLLWAGCLLAVAFPTLSGVAPPTQGLRIADALRPRSLAPLTDLLFVPGMIGLGLALFLPGLALGLRRPAWVKTRHLRGARLLLLRAPLAVIAVCELLLLTHLWDIFPGDVFSQAGFVVIQQANKPKLFALPVYFGFEAVAMFTAILFVWRRRSWWPSATGRPGGLLLVLALSQLLPLALVPYVAFDRYYLPATLLLVPLAAKVASTAARPVLVAWLALAMASASSVAYVVGEQDYQAWQVARDRAACLAYQYATPDRVQAGYEANAVYVEVPYYEQHGVILGGLWTKPGDPNFSLKGPLDPLIQLETVASSDPRPGYAYASLASGKVVLAVSPGSGISLQVPPGAARCP
jgi:hypothetical protein